MSDVIPINRPRKPPPDSNWKARILTKQTKRGDSEIIDCSANAITILKNDQNWRGVIAYDRLEQAIVCKRPPPWYDDDAPDDSDPSRPWSDNDGIRIQSWLQREYYLTVSEGTAYKAAGIVAESNTFDPLLDWMMSLRGTWDGIPRVTTCLSRYFGAEDTDYTRFIGQAFLVGSVARALVPGEKMDTMLIVEGPQGLFKSQGVERLYGSDYFRETPIDLRSNDRFLALRGCWCREWPELDGLGKADAARVKSYLSPRVDDYRAPYGRGMMRAPRRTVFVATVNPPQLGYLVDESGNRRMWPFEAGKVRGIDLDGITADRLQIWAEALDLYDSGVKWWPRTPEERRLCNQEQEVRMVSEIWTGKIEQWLDQGARSLPGGEITIREVLTDCIGMTADKQERGAQTRVGAVLAKLGWVLGGRQGSGKRERFYVRKPEEVERHEDEPAEREALRLQ